MAATMRNVKLLNKLLHLQSRCMRTQTCQELYLRHCTRLNTNNLLLSRFSTAIDKEHCNIGTIGHVDHGKTTLTAAITKVNACERDSSNICHFLEYLYSRASLLRCMIYYLMTKSAN